MPEHALESSPVTDPDDYYHKAERYIPGAGLGGYSLPDDVRFIIERGEGSRVLSVDGRWYVDYVGGAGANIIGHCHPDVVEAIRVQADRGLHYFGTLNDVAVELAEKLVEIIPCAEKVVLTTTGSEATFYAMRIARAYSGRTKVLKFEGAYHGNHDYSSFSLFPTEPADYPRGKADSGGVPEVLADTVLVAPYNDLDVAEQIIREHRDDLALVIVEPVQRIIFADPAFLAGLRRICGREQRTADVRRGSDRFPAGARRRPGAFRRHPRPGQLRQGRRRRRTRRLRSRPRPTYWTRPIPSARDAPTMPTSTALCTAIPWARRPDWQLSACSSRPGSTTGCSLSPDHLLKRLQAVLDDNGVPAIAAGSQSFWQILFLAEPPRSQVDIMNSDTAAMRRLDTELLRRGIYVLPGVRRFVSIGDQRGGHRLDRRDTRLGLQALVANRKVGTVPCFLNGVCPRYPVRCQGCFADAIERHRFGVALEGLRVPGEVTALRAFLPPRGSPAMASDSTMSPPVLRPCRRAARLAAVP